MINVLTNLRIQALYNKQLFNYNPYIINMILKNNYSTSTIKSKKRNELHWKNRLMGMGMGIIKEIKYG